MHSPIIALAWEIWRRNRTKILIVAGMILFGWILNALLPVSFRATDSARERLMTLNCFIAVGSLVLVFGTFNYTEFNPQREWNGFPYRLFALPVRTSVLVLLPLLLGVIATGLVFGAWLKLVCIHDKLARPGWLAVLISAYMVYYQTILWTMAAFRVLRIIVLGLVGTSFIGVGLLPFFAQYYSSAWFSEKVLIVLVAGLAVIAAAIAIISVGRQRRGGGHRRKALHALFQRMADAAPRRAKHFRSPAAAQLWFEWRRTGLLLPSAVGALLLLVIAPLSWTMRNDHEVTVWILAWTLATPMLLAVPIGKGFSRADFWSTPMELPAFLAVRPLSSADIVITKLKVAALSAALSWSLVIAFLAAWLSTWANIQALSMVRAGFWMIYEHSVYPQYVMAALFVIAGYLLTWKFLVGGLWIGLSGNLKLFVVSGAAYLVLAVACAIGLEIALNHDATLRLWIRDDPNRLLSWLVWSAAFAVIAKFWIAAWSWRLNSPARVLRYLLLWIGGTVCMVSLAMMIWAKGTLSLMLMAVLKFLPLDPSRLLALLVLLAVLVMPLARLGLATSFLTKNRHR